jgi:hypothetical protein
MSMERVDVEMRFAELEKRNGSLIGDPPFETIPGPAPAQTPEGISTGTSHLL